MNALASLCPLTGAGYYHPATRMLEVLPEELVPGLVAAGRFRLEKRIGAGGMGEVWSAVQLVTGKSVALKFLKPSRAADARSHARLALEARAASAVRHPNVAEIHDVAELDSGLPFLVMDLLEGETLAARLEREKRIAPRAAAALLLPVVDAVAAAHAAGVVHRDLKPENVFLCATEGDSLEVRVLDFGIAKLTRAGDALAAQPLTSTGEMLGTSLYMAPEQVFAETDIDARADVWSLGVILYEVLSGTRPTQRATVGQVLKAITTDDIVPLGDVAAEIPPPLARIVMRMLSRDRNERPDLARVKQALVSVANDTLEPSPGSPRAGRVGVGAAVLLAVGALGVAVVFAMPLGRASGPRPTSGAAQEADPARPSERSGGAASAATEQAAPAADPIGPAAPALATDRGDPRVPAPHPSTLTKPRYFATPPADAGPPPGSPTSGIILTHDRK